MAVYPCLLQAGLAKIEFQNTNSISLSIRDATFASLLIFQATYAITSGINSITKPTSIVTANYIMVF